MSEADFQAAVLALCKHLGVFAYHPHDSRRSVPGYPDLTIVGANGVMFRELKSAKGRLSADQIGWIAALEAAGADVAVWRPDQLGTDVRTQLQRLGRLPASVPRPLPQHPFLHQRKATKTRSTAR